MTPIMSREIRLAARPVGRPSAEHFSLAQVPVGSPDEGQVLVRNLFMSVDPYMRGRMNDRASYVAPFELDRPLSGGAVGEVIESRAAALRPGDAVLSNYGWREYFVAQGSELRRVSAEFQPLSVYLGALGMPGMTAWVGWQLVGLKPGETVFVSGAAGAVGHVAGQLARIYGCRVVGSAGSAAKVRFLLEECGFDRAFNYKEGPIGDQLKAAAPDGIDLYFDNVAGEALEAALSALRLHGRIVACGGISMYNDQKPRRGPSNLFNIVIKRLTMKGLIVSDWLDRQAEFQDEVGGYLRAGTLKNKETVVHGLDQAVMAFMGLFDGSNVGKMVVQLA
jgi:hypothetical protein